MIGKHILLTLIVGAAMGALLWQHPPVAWTALPVAGLSLLIVGFILWTVARFQLGASFAVKAEARQLVTRGLYSKIRNPIYVFGSVVMAGRDSCVRKAGVAADLPPGNSAADLADWEGVGSVGVGVWRGVPKVSGGNVVLKFEFPILQFAKSQVLSPLRGWTYSLEESCGVLQR